LASNKEPQLAQFVFSSIAVPHGEQNLAPGISCVEQRVQDNPVDGMTVLDGYAWE